MKIIAEIPARAGSERVKNKNMKLLNGVPMISYAIKAAKESKLLTDIYVNTDSDEIGTFSNTFGVQYYKRQAHLASNSATSDEYNYDFFKKIAPDLLVQVNPVCPLITGIDIDNTIKYFLDKEIDSLITVREEKFQAFYNGRSINFDINKPLPRTQDLTPVLICSWPVCIWRRETFMESFEKKGHAVFSGKLDFYPMSSIKSLKISYESDFLFAEKILETGISL